MPSDYTIEWWDNDRTVLMVTVHGLLTWDQYRTGMSTIHQTVAASNGIVDVIYRLDGNITSVLPPGGAIQYFNRTLDSMPTNLGAQILVKSPKLLQTTIQIYLLSVGQYVELPVFFVGSMKEAIEIVNEQHRSSGLAGVV